MSWGRGHATWWCALWRHSPAWWHVAEEGLVWECPDCLRRAYYDPPDAEMPAPAAKQERAAPTDRSQENDR